MIYPTEQIRWLKWVRRALSSTTALWSKFCWGTCALDSQPHSILCGFMLTKQGLNKDRVKDEPVGAWFVSAPNGVLRERYLTTSAKGLHYKWGYAFPKYLVLYLVLVLNVIEFCFLYCHITLSMLYFPWGSVGLWPADAGTSACLRWSALSSETLC